MGEEAPALGNPAPLGLAGFALTTFVLSCMNAQILPPAVTFVFVPLALFYGGMAQFSAGMHELTRPGGTFGGVAFSSYGAFWIALGMLVILIATGVFPAKYELPALALTLVAWTIFTFYMWIGTFRLNWALVIVFTTLIITFILLDVGHIILMLGGNGTPANIAGGGVGIICAFSAWYVSAAEVLNEVFKKTVVPLGPIG